MTRLSCIMISCDLEKEKGLSVFHSICSILNQDLDTFELIVVDNSNKKDNNNVEKLTSYFNSVNKKRKKPIKIKIINKSKPLNVNVARNIGAKAASGDVLVFIEADTMLLNNDCFSSISKFSKKFDFGYGARRYWTKIGWFEANSKAVLEEVLEGKNDLLKLNIGDYPDSFKNKKDGEVFCQLQEHTFIANFGFCKKQIFLKLKGFPLYGELDLSDDCLMYRLFKSGYKYKFLGNFSVAHVSHKRSRINHSSNLHKYFQELVSDNNYWFHVSKTFRSRVKLPDAIEKLKEVHYDYRIMEMYSKYLLSYPLDIKYAGRSINSWRRDNVFNIIDFSLLIESLIEARNIDDFIKTSRSDFDNLAALIKIAIDNDVISIDKMGNINSSGFFSVQKYIFNKDIKFIPNDNFNQFPCDNNSRYRRARFLVNRYPFVEYLRFAIIGEDDFLSPLFENEANFFPVVLEKDKRIIKKIQTINNKIEVHSVDLADSHEFNNTKIKKVGTFIVDPPYTFHGALTFILRGLALLPSSNDVKEFYVILNPTMIGNNFYKILKVLSQSEVYLHEVVENFSQYKLPKNYKEYSRASIFLKNLHLPKGIINYSSSSSMYIFRTINPKLKNIEKHIDYGKIYEHYL